MKKIHLALATAAAFAMAGPVLAGNASMTNSQGDKLTIKCQNSGCKVQLKKPNASWATVERMGGGTKNFKTLKAKYEGMGFN